MQHEITYWFDRTYKRRGLKYLRPMEAYSIFLTLLQAKKDETLLDVACGGGLLLKQSLQRGLQTCGIDISPVAIELAKSLVPEAILHVSNAEELPFADQTFDCITCLGSLERFINRNKALLEMKRVSKRNARFCIMVRNAHTFSWLFLRRLLGLQNKTANQDAKSLTEWKQLFEQADFVIDGVYPDHWPIQRLKKWLLLNRGVDYEKIRKPFISLNLSKEFIFILRQK